MSGPTIQVLNQVLAMHYRSLPMYLHYAQPAWHGNDEKARQTLAVIVEDHQRTVSRLGELILELGGIVRYGEFPMFFTGYHDLSFEFLLTKCIEFQRRDIRILERCVSQLQQDAGAKALVEEALGAAKGHLESLQEIVPQQAGATR